MTGGIVWRLVVSEVSFPEALHGPTTATTIHGRGLFVPSPKSDYNYCDDTLSESEAEAISGRIYCYTGMSGFFVLFSTYIFIHCRSRSTARRAIVVAYGSAVEGVYRAYTMGWTTGEVFQAARESARGWGS
jgi:hypothetical protein